MTTFSNNRVTHCIVALLTLSLFSCVKNINTTSTPDDYNSQKIKVSASDAEESFTKTTLNGVSTSWVETTDKIGIYCPQARPAPGGSAGITNSQFIAQQSGLNSDFSGDMYWGTGSHTFYSYYPYKSGSALSSAVPLEVPISQTQSSGNNTEHIGALDFMIATPVTVAAGNVDESVPVDFRFNHLCAILEFRLRRTGGSGNITKVKLTAPTNRLATLYCTVDITQSTPAAGSPYTIVPAEGARKEVTLTITDGVTPTDDFSTTPAIYMVILPGDHTGHQMTIGVETESSGTFINYTKTGINFQRGKKYVVNQDIITTYPNTAYTPVTIDHGGSVGTLTWAPVNCGYSSVHTKGLLYQWGRLYGQGGAGEEDAGFTITAGPVDNATGNNSANSNVFYSSVAGDWCTPALESWNMASANPCPTGWRIPTYEEFKALTSIGTTWVAAGLTGSTDGLAGRKIVSGSSTLFFPLTGMRNFSGVTGSGTSGLYWTTYLSPTTLRPYYFYFDQSYAGYNTQQYRGYGYAVRCVKSN